MREKNEVEQTPEGQVIRKKMRFFIKNKNKMNLQEWIFPFVSPQNNPPAAPAPQKRVFFCLACLPFISIHLFPTKPPEHVPINLGFRTPLHNAPQRHRIAAIARRRPQRRRAGHGRQPLIPRPPAGGGGRRGAGGVIRVRLLPDHGRHGREAQIVVDGRPPPRLLARRVGRLSRVRRREDRRLRLAVRAFPTRVRRCAVLCEAVIRPRRRGDGVFAILRSALAAASALLRDRAQGLAVRAVELLVLVHVARAPVGAHHVAHVWVRCVRGDEGLGLRRDGREDALLLEALAVLALARRVVLEARAANLRLLVSL